MKRHGQPDAEILSVPGQPEHLGPLRGHCLCGLVHYAARGPAGRMWYCYCKACVKSSGVGFGTWIEVPGITWMEDAGGRCRFSDASGLQRSFCGTCGSVLPAEHLDGRGALLPAGGLETVHGLQPGWHAFPAERKPWLPLSNDVRRFQATHRTVPHSPSLPEVSCGATQPGSLQLQGSCLCGAVAFESEPPMYAMRVCHCSRCRRRSGSSYFVGGACSTSGLRFIHGEGMTRTWTLPGSARYVVRFCTGCGSAVPVTIGPAAFIPAGCLDRDPGVRPRCHIYFASRAGWIVREDDLPCFAGPAPRNFRWTEAD